MTSRPFLRRPGVLLALALAAVAAAVSIVGKLAGGPDSSQTAIALESPRGAEAYPAFSPDGKSLVFSARMAKDEPYHLYIRALPKGARRQLTNGDGSDTGPTWSPDGASVAFLRVEDGQGECLVAPVAGGEARKIADCGPQSQTSMPSVAWMPDSKSLLVTAAEEGRLPAIALVAISGGTPTRITDPPAGTQGDSTPAVSPDGRTLAFVRAAASEGDDIYTCDLTGHNLQRLTFDNQPIRGLAWTTGGSHLVYAAQRLGNWRLLRIPAAGGSARDIGITGRSAQYPAIGAGRLAYTLNSSTSTIWRAPLGAGPGTEGEELIRSTGSETYPSYSPDGKLVADISDQTGWDEVWLSNADGGNRRQITRLKGRSRPTRPRWSPDGQTLVFEASTGVNTSEIDVVRVSGGDPKRILGNAGSPSWSQDGRFIYFAADGNIGKVAGSPDAGGSRVTLTRQPGARQPQESLDGKYVYFLRYGAVISRIPADGGAEEELLGPSRDGFILGTGRVTSMGMYYLERSFGGRRNVGRGAPRGPRLSTVSLLFFDFDSKQTKELFSVQSRDINGISISPDEKYLLYARTDEGATTLMLVEDFR